MSDIRALIREVLAEEIAAIRAELTAGPRQEQVRVATAADLTQFALSVLDRAAGLDGELLQAIEEEFDFEEGRLRRALGEADAAHG